MADGTSWVSWVLVLTLLAVTAGAIAFAGGARGTFPVLATYVLMGVKVMAFVAGVGYVLFWAVFLICAGVWLLRERFK